MGVGQVAAAQPGRGPDGRRRQPPSDHHRPDGAGGDADHAPPGPSALPPRWGARPRAAAPRRRARRRVPAAGVDAGQPRGPAGCVRRRGRARRADDGSRRPLDRRAAPLPDAGVGARRGLRGHARPALLRGRGRAGAAVGAAARGLGRRRRRTTAGEPGLHGSAEPRRRRVRGHQAHLAPALAGGAAARADRRRRGRPARHARPQGSGPGGHGPARPVCRCDGFRKVGAPAHPRPRPRGHALLRDAELRTRRLQGRCDVRGHGPDAARRGRHHEPRGRPDACRPHG